MCLGIPGLVVSVSGDGVYRTGKIGFGGITKEINLAFVPEAAVGDYVITHAGIAISVINKEEAEKTLAYIELGMGN